MGLFSMRRPRGFRHEYMFADKRKERLKAIEERAKAELGKQQSQSGGHEEIRGMFFDATRHARRRKERRLRSLRCGGAPLRRQILFYID